MQIAEGDKHKKNDKPKEDKDVRGKKLLKGTCLNQQVPEQLKLPKGLIVIDSALSCSIFGDKKLLTNMKKINHKMTLYSNGRKLESDSMALHN